MKRNTPTFYIFILSILLPNVSVTCTIFSAKDKSGNVWMGNNEDAAFSFRNYINVFPKAVNNKFGYYTLSRDKIENGQNAQTAGGMNEAGLSFDFNSTQLYPVKNIYLKKGFPQGDDAILSYILGNLSKVEEVISFFEKYWFHFGFRSAQMHVADRNGHFALISPTGSQLLTEEPFQISTNYDICSKADSNNCWRFPIVRKALSEAPPSLELFTKICRETSQRRYTIYSTVNNLATGEINIYFAGEYSRPYKTTMNKLLLKGRSSYSMEDLFNQNKINIIYKTYKTKGIEPAYAIYKKFDLSKSEKDILLPNLVDYFVNDINHYDIYPFLEEYVNTYSPELDYWLVQVAIEFQKGELAQSQETLKKTELKFPGQVGIIRAFTNRLSGKPDENFNAPFILNGYSKAKFVIVKCKTMTNTFSPYNNITFLSKQEDHWALKMNLPEGIYDYVFIVDGKEILDAKTPVKTVKNLIGESVKCHELSIGMSDQIYPLTIEIEVPNKTDEVYIVGNQEAIFPAPLIFMNQKSDFKRSISLNVHYPAKFKFVTGAGKHQAILSGKEDSEVVINDATSNSFTQYKIIGWKE